MSESCGNCRYFFDEFKDNGHTVCRRYPKSYFLEAPAHVEHYTGKREWGSPCGFPYVERNEWCGEWKATPAALDSSSPPESNP